MAGGAHVTPLALPLTLPLPVALPQCLPLPLPPAGGLHRHTKGAGLSLALTQALALAKGGWVIDLEEFWGLGGWQEG